MGFDWKKIPQIYYGEKCLSTETYHLNNSIKNYMFLPSSGWKDHIELNNETNTVGK